MSEKKMAHFKGSNMNDWIVDRKMFMRKDVEGLVKFLFVRERMIRALFVKRF